MIITSKINKIIGNTHGIICHVNLSNEKLVCILKLLNKNGYVKTHQNRKKYDIFNPFIIAGFLILYIKNDSSKDLTDIKSNKIVKINKPNNIRMCVFDKSLKKIQRTIKITSKIQSIPNNNHNLDNIEIIFGFSSIFHFNLVQVTNITNYINIFGGYF